MNSAIFDALNQIRNNLILEKDKKINSEVLNEIKNKCQHALNLIQELSFENNSPHVKLATKQAIQYLNKAITEIEAYFAGYNQINKTSTENLQDIYGPAKAGLEIILNLDFK